MNRPLRGLGEKPLASGTDGTAASELGDSSGPGRCVSRSPGAPRADAEDHPMSELTVARRMTLDYLRACADIFTDAILDLVGQGDLANLATTLEPDEVDEALANLRSAWGAIDGMITALERRGD